MFLIGRRLLNGGGSQKAMLHQVLCVREELRVAGIGYRYVALSTVVIRG